MSYMCNCGEVFNNPEERTAHSVSCSARVIGTVVGNKAREIIFDVLYRNAPYNQGLIADEILRDLLKEGWKPPVTQTNSGED